MMTWREKIRWHRHRLRMTQAELGAAIGLQQPRIGRWESGEGMPTMEQGLRLARALGVPYDYLADDAQAEPPRALSNADEAMILEMARTVGMAEAKRRLLAAPAAPSSAVPPVVPDYGRVAAEQDLTASTRQRIRAAKRQGRPRGGSGDSEADAKGQDEGTDSAGPPRRRR
jgi:transcriptional regulator with XRE-family HTH domain